ncbi:MAG: hypothetical protein FJZ98_05030 [Chloroflexi bacterium]|nr:hypothetical protein [Chloroflexota bacterium]
MAEELWLVESVGQAEKILEGYRNRKAEECAKQKEIDRLAALDEVARQPILAEAEKFLAARVVEVNELADSLARYAKAPVDKPVKMTPELFIHPYNVAPRLRWRVNQGGRTLDYASYFNWRIRFYETELRLCLTISEQEEPLYVTAKDMDSNSLFRLATINLDDVKRRLRRNVKRHYYLNELYGKVD